MPTLRYTHFEYTKQWMPNTVVSCERIEFAKFKRSQIKRQFNVFPLCLPDAFLAFDMAKKRKIIGMEMNKWNNSSNKQKTHNFKAAHFLISLSEIQFLPKSLRNEKIFVFLQLQTQVTLGRLLKTANNPARMRYTEA